MATTDDSLRGLVGALDLALAEDELDTAEDAATELLSEIRQRQQGDR
jgi:hypothetical protein